MFIKLGLILLAPFLLMTGVLGATGVVIVEVREQDGIHIVVPVPLLVAKAALSLAPDDCKYVEAAEAARYVPMADKIVKELRAAPDFVLVEIEDGTEHVLVRKEGDDILVEVRDGRDESVRCKVPLDGIADILGAYDGHGFPAKAALAALRHASRGEILHVQDGGDEVRIRKL